LLKVAKVLLLAVTEATTGANETEAVAAPEPMLFTALIWKAYVVVLFKPEIVAGDEVITGLNETHVAPPSIEYW
jgi:hypothetical protein